MIIDCHAHTSNHKLWGLHTDSATIEDLERLAEKFGICKIVLMATYFPFKKTGLTNQELLARIAGNGLFCMFGSLDIMNNFQAGLRELEALAEKKLIAGIKLYPGYQNFKASDEKVFLIYELAQRFGLPVMFHTGELHHCCSREKREKGDLKCNNDFCWLDRLQHLSHPEQMRKAAQSFPDVTFVLSHLANPYFKDLRQLMAECENVHTDMSGQFLSDTEEDNPDYRQLLKREIIKFLQLPQGIDRLMFGTDFPIQSYQDSVDLIKMLGLSEEEKGKIFYKNAQKLLGL